MSVLTLIVLLCTPALVRPADPDFLKRTHSGVKPLGRQAWRIENEKGETQMINQILAKLASAVSKAAPQSTVFPCSSNNRQRALAVQLAAILVSGTLAIQLRAQTIDAAAQTDSLAATNGNKVAVAPSGRLHAVYVKDGGIYYAWSAYGQIWAGVFLPLTKNSGASQPTVAVASDGTVGVVYKDGSGGMQYQWCNQTNINLPCGTQTSVTWQGPYKAGNGAHPSLVAFQNDMYLASVGGATVTYSKFSAKLTVPRRRSGRVRPSIHHLMAGSTHT
jgi:hypothetical protein